MSDLTRTLMVAVIVGVVVAIARGLTLTQDLTRRTDSVVESARGTPRSLSLGQGEVGP